jgi:hypothetical protein
MGNKKEMLLEPGSKGYSTSLIGPIELVKKGNAPGVWEVITLNGDIKFVSEYTFYDFPEKEKNPWKRFADNGDDPPESLTFGFSRFVIGRDIDGEKYPVIFDNRTGKWLTPIYPKVIAGEFWEEVEVVEWREL